MLNGGGGRVLWVGWMGGCLGCKPRGGSTQNQDIYYVSAGFPNVQYVHLHSAADFGGQQIVSLLGKNTIEHILSTVCP